MVVGGGGVTARPAHLGGEGDIGRLDVGSVKERELDAVDPARCGAAHAEADDVRRVERVEVVAVAGHLEVAKHHGVRRREIDDVERVDLYRLGED